MIKRNAWSEKKPVHQLEMVLPSLSMKTKSAATVRKLLFLHELLLADFIMQPSRISKKNSPAPFCRPETTTISIVQSQAAPEQSSRSKFLFYFPKKSIYGIDHIITAEVSQS